MCGDIGHDRPTSEMAALRVTSPWGAGERV